MLVGGHGVDVRNTRTLCARHLADLFDDVRHP